MVAARIATLKDGQRKSAGSIGPPSQPEAAQMLNVGRESVQRAGKSKGQNDPLKTAEGLAVGRRYNRQKKAAHGRSGRTFSDGHFGHPKTAGDHWPYICRMQGSA